MVYIYHNKVDSTGDDAKTEGETFQAVREAIEHRSWKEAEEQAVVVAGAIRKFAGEIGHAADIVSRERGRG